ncbi:MAG: hypothetical protein PUA77_04810 [Lachnospiraceae bacterium]|nr:hypothetical protein [Agathobacter sp.]MDD6291096.1 hypothetical protein [Lachnospiraceae bacterium]
MSQIIKAFMGIFLTLFMTVTAMGILSAYMEVMNAQDMQARIVDEIENSNYNPGVIRECFRQSSQSGYQLSITLFGEEGALVTMHSEQEVSSKEQEIELAKVEMCFPFRVAFLGIDQTHTFVSYAR